MMYKNYLSRPKTFPEECFWFSKIRPSALKIDTFSDFEL